jgi:hypothetical protein
MQRPKWWDSPRLEMFLALLIVIVSLTPALSVW